MLLPWLVLVLVWASEGSGCETGVAFERNVLSVPRSLMANADVALLKNFTADSVKQCMEQCCTGRFGACSVASFVRNSTNGNCLHFYCRPLPKCKFQPSDMTDSFSFSSNPTPAPSTGGPPSSTTTTPTVALKNDNTTVKARKGVDDPTRQKKVLGDLVTEDKSSGIKPRKGVSMDDDLQPPFKSNVKARKGVDPPPPTMTVTTRDDLSDLEKILEDDPAATTVKSSSTAVQSSSTTSPSTVVQSSSSTVTTTSTTSTIVVPTYTTTKSPETSTTQTSSSTSLLRTLVPVAPFIDVSTTQQPALVSSANRLVTTDEEEEEKEENERRYKSSIHLVLSLVFGLLVLFAVLGVAGKRIYDGWLRRDYYRMNYLIDGIYNGVEG